MVHFVKRRKRRQAVVLHVLLELAWFGSDFCDQVVVSVESYFVQIVIHLHGLLGGAAAAADHGGESDGDLVSDDRVIVFGDVDVVRLPSVFDRYFRDVALRSFDADA